jgi:hypothetical protein
MSGAIIPLPNTPSWRGAPLKNRDNFTFYIYIYREREREEKRHILN